MELWMEWLIRALLNTDEIQAQRVQCTGLVWQLMQRHTSQHRRSFNPFFSFRPINDKTKTVGEILTTLEIWRARTIPRQHQDVYNPNNARLEVTPKGGWSIIWCQRQVSGTGLPCLALQPPHCIKQAPRTGTKHREPAPNTALSYALPPYRPTHASHGHQTPTQYTHK